MKRLYGRPVFALAEETFVWEDVILHAVVSGTWAAVDQEVRLGLAWASLSEGEGDALEGALEEAAQEFRYERDLVTAQEMEHWLAQRGLTAAEWFAHLRLKLLAASGRDRGPDLADRYTPPNDELSAALAAELLSSARGEALALDLAEVAAAAVSAGNGVGSVQKTPPPADLPPDFPTENLSEQLQRIARLRAGLERFRAARVNPEALERAVALHQMDWIRVDVSTLRFGDPGGAREAGLCLRQDRLALEEVAAMARITPVEQRLHLDQLDPTLRSQFLAAQPGEILGPLAAEAGYALFRIDRKVMPEVADSEIRHRAEQRVLRREMEAEFQRRIRWLLPW
jgi:hypothetical protein